MSDLIDDANDQVQLITDKLIAIGRGRPLNIFQNESGLCWECSTPVNDGRRWCSKECAGRSDR